MAKVVWVICHRCGEEHIVDEKTIPSSYRCAGMLQTIVEGDEVFSAETGRIEWNLG